MFVLRRDSPVYHQFAWGELHRAWSDLLRRRAICVWIRRWSSLLSCAVVRAFASSWGLMAKPPVQEVLVARQFGWGVVCSFLCWLISLSSSYVQTNRCGTQLQSVFGADRSIGRSKCASLEGVGPSRGTRSDCSGTPWAQLTPQLVQHSVFLPCIPLVVDVQSVWSFLLHCVGGRANYFLRPNSSTHLGVWEWVQIDHEIGFWCRQHCEGHQFIAIRHGAWGDSDSAAQVEPVSLRFGPVGADCFHMICEIHPYRGMPSWGVRNKERILNSNDGISQFRHVTTYLGVDDTIFEGWNVIWKSCWLRKSKDQEKSYSSIIEAELYSFMKCLVHASLPWKVDWLVRWGCWNLHEDWRENPVTANKNNSLSWNKKRHLTRFACCERKACLRNIHDLDHISTHKCLEACLTKSWAKADNLITAVKQGIYWKLTFIGTSSLSWSTRHSCLDSVDYQCTQRRKCFC